MEYLKAPIFAKLLRLVCDTAALPEAAKLASQKINPVHPARLVNEN
jgi:hypothetical protein